MTCSSQPIGFPVASGRLVAFGQECNVDCLGLEMGVFSFFFSTDRGKDRSIEQMITCNALNASKTSSLMQPIDY